MISSVFLSTDFATADSFIATSKKEVVMSTNGLQIRGKEKTRHALITAAQQLIVQGQVNSSIQEITALAGVGFGSFYNHFATKEELFSEAISATLDAYGLFRDGVVEGIDDPAEIFAVSFRMTGRLQRVQPDLIHILLNSGTSVLATDRGLRPRALADIQKGMETERFLPDDPEAVMMLVGGALMGLLQYLEINKDADDAAISDAATEKVLLLLGMDPEEARDLAHQELSSSVTIFAQGPE